MGYDRSMKMWQPDPAEIDSLSIVEFRQSVASRYAVPLTDYQALHRWSVQHRAEFWDEVGDYCGVRLNQPDAAPSLVETDSMQGACWYPDATLNFAENLLFGGRKARADSDDAIVFRGEDDNVRMRLTQGELLAQVTRLASALADDGVVAGTRVAAYVANTPEADVAMLAVTSLGGVWSSCSPDFGIDGVHDRFGQIEPEVLFCINAYHYGGKTHDVSDTVSTLVERLPSVRRVVEINFVNADHDSQLRGTALALRKSWAEYLEEAPERALVFTQVPFSHPLYIMFSSGTTGKPKCIIHGTGGTLLQHVKEHVLHAGVMSGDRVFFFTTCGWMMWNWLVSGLAAGATLMLYDGSPFHPDGNVLFDYAAEENFTHFGISAKFIDACRNAQLDPMKTHDLSCLRVLMSTGSTLLPESFDYVYKHIKKDVCLSSMSGGTDIVSCFVLGNPELAVFRGELQCPGLGMDIQVFDEQGKALPVDEPGELVCTQAFPSMPIGFYGDVDGSRYFKAYFDRFDNVWCHGDWSHVTQNGGLVIHGRSDATLNPGGVRIGTAEIYRQVEVFDEVLESIVIGQNWQGDTRVVLFVRMAEGTRLDDELISRIKSQIRISTTPRHVPAKIIEVSDIPRTKSGKIVELAVRKVVHGQAIDNAEALMNPEALELYRDVPELC